MPCFASAVGSILGFVIGYFYLKESNPNVVAHKQQEKDRKLNEQTSLLRNDTRVNHEDVEENDSKKTVMPKSGSMRNISRASIVVILSYS